MSHFCKEPTLKHLIFKSTLVGKMFSKLVNPKNKSPSVKKKKKKSDYSFALNPCEVLYHISPQIQSPTVAYKMMHDLVSACFATYFTKLLC